MPLFLAVLTGGLLGCGALALLLRFADRHLTRHEALLGRRLDLDERAVVLNEKRAIGTKPPGAIPPDLFRRISQWGDLIAQESERKLILDLYAEFADENDPWDRVRQHLPPLPSDTVAEVFTG